MMMSRSLVVTALIAWSSPAVSQDVAPRADATTGDSITEKRVLEVLSHLASDEMAGRDTPSPQLEAAADWIRLRLEKAGLEPLSKEMGWFHGYELPGVRLDSTQVALTVHRQDLPDVEFVPDVEVRWLTGGRKGVWEDVEVSVGRPNDPLDRRILRSGFARRPILLSVRGDDPLWARASGQHASLRAPRAGSQPVLLVRADKMPGGALRATIRTPEPVQGPIPLRNVVGMLKGATRPDEFVVVSAHYDHIGIRYSGGEDSIYNGADDDATGTTAVICIAEALAKGPRPDRSILFVAFSAEEKGLRGSRAFVDDAPVPMDAVVANVNIEMLGRPEAGKEKEAWITGVENSDFAEYVERGLERSGVKLVPFARAGALFFASDNASFLRQRVVAHSISAGHLHRDYHGFDDEVDRIQIPHMTAVIQGIREAVLEIANAEERPKWNERGLQLLERRGR